MNENIQLIDSQIIEPRLKLRTGFYDSYICKSHLSVAILPLCPAEGGSQDQTRVW